MEKSSKTNELKVILLVIAKFDVIKGSQSRELFLPESSMTAMSIDQPFTVPSESAQTTDSEIGCSCSNADVRGSPTDEGM